MSMAPGQISHRWVNPYRFFRPDVHEECQAALKVGSKSFYVSSLLLPSAYRRHVLALYAYCRQCDDLVDEATHTEAMSQELEQRLDCIYADPVKLSSAERAFADVVVDCDIPKVLPRALIEGFEWDDAGRTYDTLDDLIGYCVRVASTVGLMMTLVMGRRSPETLQRAAELGIAMQLTNIARDVGEDARNGRLYLPVDWLVEAGIDSEAFLKSPRFSEAMGRVVKRLLEVADLYYASAAPGIAELPAGCRTGIRSASVIYRQIGDVIARNGFNSIDHRAYTGLGAKLRLAAGAVLPQRASGYSVCERHADVAMLIEAIDACARKSVQPHPSAGATDRFLDILLHVKHRQQEPRAASRRMRTELSGTES